MTMEVFLAGLAGTLFVALLIMALTGRSPGSGAARRRRRPSQGHRGAASARGAPPPPRT